MEFRERLNQLRREKGLSQEQLAEMVGVTRQAVQKWEAGTSRPDMDNLVTLARYFGVSLDYLITGTESAQMNQAHTVSGQATQNPTIVKCCCRWEYEYKSKRTLWGLPLIHIHLRENGFARAKGIIAIGNVATGLISIGIICVGLVSLGVISLGLLLSIGCLSLGLLSIGGFAAGAVAIGGFAFGWLALGGICYGVYAAGGVAAAAEIAAGGVAQAPLAIGAAAEGAKTFVIDPGGTASPETRAAIREAVSAVFAGRHPWLEAFFESLF